VRNIFSFNFNHGGEQKNFKQVGPYIYISYVLFCSSNGDIFYD